MHRLKGQNLALRKLEEARFCRQQLKGVEMQLDLAREEVICVEKARAKAATRSKGDWHSGKMNAT